MSILQPSEDHNTCPIAQKQQNQFLLELLNSTRRKMYNNPTARFMNIISSLSDRGENRITVSFHNNRHTILISPEKRSSCGSPTLYKKNLSVYGPVVIMYYSLQMCSVVVHTFGRLWRAEHHEWTRHVILVNAHATWCVVGGDWFEMRRKVTARYEAARLQLRGCVAFVGIQEMPPRALDHYWKT